MAKINNLREIINTSVIVAALGYFVDIYDLVLFSIVRVDSLKSLGLAGQELFDDGVLLLNAQMAGMLVGGIFWGILGDKKGRLSVLFGSILIYSLANIANGFIQNVEQYALMRFVAGLGLAGELGAGITLVTEVLPKHRRGYGTMIVATVGTSGAILANFIAEHYDWRTCYFIGGGLGLILLVLRISVYESGMFTVMIEQNIKRGHFLSLFNNKERFLNYLKCIAIGLPVWYVVGVLITFSPEFGKTFGIKENISAGKAIMYSYLGLVIGDFASGTLSQLLKSRKKVIYLFLSLSTVFIAIYLMLPGISAASFYFFCLLLGLGSGYWVIFATIAAEQFGTNLRATVATTVPNFVRGAVVPITLLFQYLKTPLGIVFSGAIVGAICVLTAFLAEKGLKETFSKELNYVE